MPRVSIHHHPCADCGAKTPCDGTWEENYDGTPEVICPEYHRETYWPEAGDARCMTNDDFICEACEFKRDDARAQEVKEDHEGM